MNAWQTRNRRTAFEADDYLSVELHEVELPDGEVIEDWPWIVTPDYVNVVAITEAELFVCFRQTKYAVEDQTLAVVGGYLDPDEDPLDAAKRELLEETGYEAGEWIPLGDYAVDGNRGAGRAHLFLAINARRVEDGESDDLEEQELLLLERTKVEEALREGEFKVLAWSAALALALLRLE